MPAKQEDVLSNPPYKDEVLGRAVSILFENEEDAGRMDYYRGVVRRVTFTLEPNGDITFEHFVQFDDGDESWFDLAAEENAGRLQWSTTDAKPPSKKVKKESDAEESEEEEKLAEDDKTSSNDEPQLQELPNEIPSSVDDIIRLMDELEPEEHYCRRSTSGIRGKLRDFARKNQDHPAVKHWIETKKWQPPDHETLRALMDLIKTMIK